MTDNEIIKALECCSKITFSCDGCPLKHLKYSECYELVIRSTLDLINRQQAEINRINTELKATSGAALSYKEESERYKGVIKILEKDAAEAKSEAIKEFAERLKNLKHECGCNYRKKPVFAVTEDKIDNLVKEMVGGET